MYPTIRLNIDENSYFEITKAENIFTTCEVTIYYKEKIVDSQFSEEDNILTLKEESSREILVAYDSFDYYIKDMFISTMNYILENRESLENIDEEGIGHNNFIDTLNEKHDTYDLYSHYWLFSLPAYISSAGTWIYRKDDKILLEICLGTPFPPVEEYKLLVRKEISEETIRNWIEIIKNSSYKEDNLK